MAVLPVCSRALPLLIVAVLAACSIHGVSARRPSPSVPMDVSVRSVRAVGSGCPTTTPDVTISADRKAITIPFRSFQVSVPTANVADKERACMITIDLQYPAGWSYVGSSWTYQGWVELARNLKAYQSSKYYYQGGSPSCYAVHPFYGGSNGLSGRPYSYSETCDAGFVWSPCGAVRGLNVLTRIWIDNRGNPTGAGVIKSEVIDAEFVAFILHLNWRRCA